MFKLFIFDLDGTLLNTLDDLADSCNYILQQHYYPTHATEKYKYFVGDGIRKLVERALPSEVSENTKEVKKIEQSFREYYDLHKMDKTAPYTGLVSVLEKLQSRSVKLAVATNKADVMVPDLMRYYFPTIDFATTLGQRTALPVKPDPYIIHEILAQTQISPAETLYIGDTAVDMQTGKNANLYTVGVLWGFRKKNELLQHGADKIIEKPEDLLSL